LTALTKCGLSSLLGLDFLHIELELLAFQDVSVGSATLTGTAGNGGQHTAGHELLLKALLNLKKKKD
jgi:hypothetical protein